MDALKQTLRTIAVVPYDELLCITYASLRATLESQGRVVAANDLWIAASAVRHQIPLVSNNQKHFENIPGLKLITECEALKKIDAQGRLPIPTEPNPVEEAANAASIEPQRPS